MHDKIIILDFGSQTTQLIGRRVRELNTYCEIVPFNKFPFEDETVKGVILSGSPFSVNDETAFKTDLRKIRRNYPVLGICYGAQWIAYSSGGAVEKSDSREYGRAHLSVKEPEDLLWGISRNFHKCGCRTGYYLRIPEGFFGIASTERWRSPLTR